MTTTITAVNGDLVAVANESCRVLLFNNGNHSTLTYNKANNANIEKLVFCGNEYLCGLLDSKEEGAVVWSISRGVVVDVLKNIEILDIASEEEKEALYVLVANKGSKLYVHEYAVEPKKLKLGKKIKVGKIDDENGTMALAVASNQNIAVRNGASVKVYEQEAGDKVFKSKLGGATSEGKSWLCLSDEYVVTCTSSQVQIFSVKESGKLVSSIIVSEHPTQLALRGNILMVDKSLYEISSKKKVLTPTSTLDETSSDFKNLYLTFAGNNDSEEVNVVVQAPGRPVEVLKIKFLGEDGKMLKQIMLPNNEKKDENNTGSSLNISKRPSTTLGAGQAGQESLTVTDRPTKKSKPTAETEKEDEDMEEEEEEDDPTPIAQRLKQLQQQLRREDEINDNMERKGDEKSKPKKAITTESLSHLLHQALKASDENILELALAVKDQKIRLNSIDDLTSVEATEFLNKLTSRLSRRPQRALQLVPWITTLLQSGKITTMEPLVPLRNMINDRVEVFPQLLQLDGRLSLLTNMH